MTLIRECVDALWRARRSLVYVFLLCFALLIYMPFLMIALKSVGRGWFGRLWLPPEITTHWYKFAVEVTDIPEITKNTMVIAVLAVIMSTLIGIPTGWALGRRRIPGKELLMSLILLPRMIPPIAYGLGVAQIFYRTGLINTHFGVALAHVAICAPYAILVLSATFEGLDERVLEASAVCGANALRTFIHVIVPLILPGILSSMIFTFTTSYNEFTLTLLTYGKDTITLPVRTYVALGEGYWEVTSAMSIMLVVPSLLVLFLIQRQVEPEKLVGGFKGV